MHSALAKKGYGSVNDLEGLIAGLSRPEAYPHPVDRVERVETHISYVLLAGEHAYKLKKPLDLGFLDFSTLQRRHFYCEEELRLNRRLAPDLYLEVVPVTGSLECPRIGRPGDADGPVLEWAVHMRRFPQGDLLDRRSLTPEMVDLLAERLAAFHGEASRAPADSPYGTRDAVLKPMVENVNQVRARIRLPENAGRLERIEAWTRMRWLELIPVLEARRAEGRVRECHGDMHRGNIAWVDGAPLIFDALEFNPALRWIDTASELAFLLMDLQEAGELGSARRLVNRYLELSGDYGALQVLDFYKVYRAMVRAKVLAIRLGQADLSPGEVGADREECARYLALAESFTQSRRPRLLIVCGLSGSGKSRLGRRLREALPVIHVRSDVERKRLFGLAADERTGATPGSGIYFPQATAWTYERLHRLAALILASGYDVLVDATFLTRARRGLFRKLAETRNAAFAILVLDAPIEVLRRRVIRRLADGCDASEASLAVLEHQRACCECLDVAEQALAYKIDSSDPPPFEEVLAGIESITGIDRDR
jgi:aminoglycoside phosphotransferase family enzyme/predicted kinase